ncbi:MAG: aminoacyl-tRNA hydrolase [Phycisphaerae bacterium]
MKLIVGLGNPGPQYAGTRHNVGFDVVDILASRWGVGMATERFHGWFGSGLVGAARVALLKPTTFMNRSGRCVAAACRFFKLPPDALLVVTDDIALPLGRLRVRARGSSGGHNGLQDIIDRVGSSDWSRLRVGIGERVGAGTAYVLSRFSEEECAGMHRARAWAADAVACWIEHGVGEAMNRFNGADPAA